MGYRDYIEGYRMDGRIVDVLRCTGELREV